MSSCCICKFFLNGAGDLFTKALDRICGLPHENGTISQVSHPWPQKSIFASIFSSLFLLRCRSSKNVMSIGFKVFRYDTTRKINPDWTDGSVRFLFGKGGSGGLANCPLCGTETTLSFSAGPVCSSFSAEACAILHALCWSRQHQQVCHFSSLLLLSDSRSVLATLSSPPSFLLSQTLWQIWQKLSSLSCSIRLQWVPGH